MMKPRRDIILHCSVSDFGDAEEIDRWHRERGFNKIGYHYVILNGFRTKGIYVETDDGKVEEGRRLYERGAHCKENNSAIGVCIVGNRLFSAKQLYIGIPRLIAEIEKNYELTIYGHYEYNPNKSCPNIDMDLMRNILTIYNKLGPQ